MILLNFGSRTIKDPTILPLLIAEYYLDPQASIDGGAGGWDTVAHDYLSTIVPRSGIFRFFAHWTPVPGLVDPLTPPNIKRRRDGTEYDANAGFRRNWQMADNAVYLRERVGMDLLAIGVWDGVSRGTVDMLGWCIAYEIPTLFCTLTQSPDGWRELYVDEHFYIGPGTVLRSRSYSTHEFYQPGEWYYTEAFFRSPARVR